MYGICSVLWMIPNTIPLPHVGPNIVFPVFSCIINLVTGGMRGVLLKYKSPSNAICIGSFGFDISGLNRFNVNWACFWRRHHRCIGYIFRTPQSPAMKWFLYVHMSCSAAFLLRMCGGTNQTTAGCCVSEVFSDSDYFLSRKNITGLNPLFASSL